MLKFIIYKTSHFWTVSAEDDGDNSAAADTDSAIGFGKWRAIQTASADTDFEILSDFPHNDCPISQAAQEKSPSEIV
jgi:hypothetical protein